MKNHQSRGVDMSLYKLHGAAFQASWSALSQSAQEQQTVLLGAPGGLIRLSSAGYEYIVHQHFMAATGKRVQVSVGRVDDPAAQDKAQELREQIEVSKNLIERTRELAKLGYQLAPPKAYGVAAAIYNAGLFQEGLTLVGSHAYGVLLNTLGIKASGYRTDDVDLSRHHLLAVPPMNLASLLMQTGIDFVPVPPFNHGDPPTSWKERGPSQLRVDLLVPSPDDEIAFVRVPELNAYATTLPLLDYLLEDTFIGALASRHGVVPVRVPDPARFAIHKMATSQMRVNFFDKSLKDLEQASSLLAMLEENHPGEVERAVFALPPKGLEHVSRALNGVKKILEPLHPQAFESLKDCVQGAIEAEESTSMDTPKG